MSPVVDGKKIARSILESLASRVARLKKKGITPTLAAVLVGNDKPSHTYVRKKGEAAEGVGVAFLRFALPATISRRGLIQRLQEIQSRHELSGLIIQLPLPKKTLQKHKPEIINHIRESIDVDCLTDISLGRVMLGSNPLPPPTPSAMLEVLRFHKISLAGKHVVIVGRGDLIGKPLANVLLHEPVALTVLGPAVPLTPSTREADIIFTGVGKASLITGDMVKEGVVVVDGGTVFTGGKLRGDVEFESVEPKAFLITPVPGGVGPITVAKLIENVVANCERLHKVVLR